MMNISDLDLGKVDGKADFSDTRAKRHSFSDAFLVPSNVRLVDFDDGETYFIQGFRGTGKTSLLRYYVHRNQPDGKFRKVILFKSSIDEDYRVSLSKEAGFEWISTDSNRMEIAQDFKTMWKWFVLHKIGEMIQDNVEIVGDSIPAQNFLKFLGLQPEAQIEKIFGIFPKLESANVKIKGTLGVIEAELSADIVGRKSGEIVLPLRALVIAAQRLLHKLSFKKRLVIAFDELEAFYTDDATYKRDLAMVRDLLFVVDSLNQDCLAASTEVFVIAAVRSEVLFAMKARGQEIERTVHDHGVTLSWHHESRSLHHPLLEMVRRKLKASGVECDAGDDILFKYFPRTVGGIELEKYLLDNSFFKPRDLVWRLTIIQSDYPNENFFSEKVFHQTEASYSQRLWSEIEYELSASYSSEDISTIKRLFSGFRRYFGFEGFLDHVNEQIRYTPSATKFRDTHEASNLLHNLYRLGAIGNDFPIGTRSKPRGVRWIFRNEPDLLLNKQMVINSAICRALTILTRGGK
jgi:hypothetical protein